jgi:thioesterase domain-containing protein
MGWDAVATRGVDAREVPGDHDTALLEPNARILAEQLEDAMAKAEEEQRKSAG